MENARNYFFAFSCESSSGKKTIVAGSVYRPPTASHPRESVAISSQSMFVRVHPRLVLAIKNRISRDGKISNFSLCPAKHKKFIDSNYPLSLAAQAVVCLYPEGIAEPPAPPSAFGEHGKVTRSPIFFVFQFFFPAQLDGKNVLFSEK